MYSVWTHHVNWCAIESWKAARWFLLIGWGIIGTGNLKRYNRVILYWTSLKLHYIKIEEPLCLLCLLVWWQVAEAEWCISPLLAATPSYRKCGWFQGGRSGFLIDQGAIDLVCECTIDLLTICNTDRLLMPKDHLSRYGYLLSTHNEYSNGFLALWNYCYLVAGALCSSRDLVTNDTAAFGPLL